MHGLGLPSAFALPSAGGVSGSTDILALGQNMFVDQGKGKPITHWNDFSVQSKQSVSFNPALRLP